MNDIMTRFQNLAEPCRLITDILFVNGYTPEPDRDGYVSVELLEVKELPDNRLLVAFHDYGRPSNEHTIELSYEDDNFVGWEVQ